MVCPRALFSLPRFESRANRFCIPGDGRTVRSRAGEVRRPDIDARAHDITDLAYSLIRVLDTNGASHGPWNPRLDSEVLRRALRHMLLTRAYDDRMYRAQRQGKTSFYMKCTGEEAVSIAAAYALDREDMCFPSYRQQGLLIDGKRGWLDGVDLALGESGPGPLERTVDRRHRGVEQLGHLSGLPPQH